MNADNSPSQDLKIQIRGVSEQDIDLFILEELVASPRFLRFFLDEIGMKDVGRLVSAARSVNTSNGESDLELTLSDGQELTRILVENKIDAPLQPRQGIRYSDRAEAYVAAEECDAACTVLLAPSDYYATEDFDHSIEYERVIEWLDKQEDGGPRQHYKKALLTAALERASSGWTLVPDPRATDLWHRYWELATEVAPHLGMPQPGPKPATSSFVFFRPAVLSSGIKLVHKLPYGNVDLQFAGAADRADEFFDNYKDVLWSGMRIEKAGKSLVVRMPVQPIALETPFEDCKPQLRKALESARELLDWYVTVVESKQES